MGTVPFNATFADRAKDRRHRRLGIDERVVPAKHPDIVRVGICDDRLAVLPRDAHRALVKRVEPREMDLRVLDRVEQVDVALKLASEAVAFG